MTHRHDEFIRYYQQLRDKIFTYFWYRVNFDRSLAEDLTSDVFLKAYERFDSFDQTRPFKAWVYAIAHNHLVNFYKQQKPFMSLDEFDQEFASTETPVVQIEIKIEVEQILAVLPQLSAERKDIVIMRYVNELSMGEIAEILGKDEGAVRTALSRALADLRARVAHISTKPTI